MVQVVSMLDVMIKLGETVFQSKEVSGAVWSGVFELDSKAKGVSLVTGAASRLWRLMLLLCAICESPGKDHSLKWSPEVARRSVDCFCEDGGSHSSLVTGYECVASATLLNSRLNFELPGTKTSFGVGAIWASSICICTYAGFGSAIVSWFLGFSRVMSLQNCGHPPDSCQQPASPPLALALATCTSRRHTLPMAQDSCSCRAVYWPSRRPSCPAYRRIGSSRLAA
jgi:hypothetical protein